ncbi:structural maintenance of chromosomes protein 6A-like [Hibiscus syriacus]|uniref:structural maintenance of chromosomes protein 6A-like n=1 Tax=Hibiscus syriacus TaxID=106335 RepID=UPI0019248BE6|nr:structural maintenance of chromosomes protein 6A-like [Hibiscus syriacus]
MLFKSLVNIIKTVLSSLKDEENTSSEHLSEEMDAMKKINEDIKYHEKKQLEIDHQIRELRLHQANRVTVFGGDGVLRLRREIERHHRAFTVPPIDPIWAPFYFLIVIHRQDLITFRLR